MKGCPADAMWAGLIGGALAGDVWLAVRGEALLTHRARTPVGVGLQVVLVAHFAGVLPRWADPFAVVGPVARRLEARGRARDG